MIEKTGISTSWKRTKLGQVGKFFGGGTPRKAITKYWGGNIPFVTGADVISQYVSESRSYLTEAGLASGHTYICQPGTVLLVTRTRVGRVGIAAKILGASQDISAFVCSDELLPEFVYWYLYSLSDGLTQSTQGITIQGLTREYVESIPIVIPSKLEQKQIADRLEKEFHEIRRMRESAESQMRAISALPNALLRETFGELTLLSEE
ncbi:MAG TPA: restriction endonuclease subunit S [Anaerolineales bacterium]|nr:restriction endonuclease subunit S [Anaerolineales bacterium]